MRHRRGVLLLCALGGAACAKQADLVPEPQQFALGCPGFEPGWPPDSLAPLVVLGRLADLRFRGDTVGWARQERKEEDEGFLGSVVNRIWQNMLESWRHPIPLIAVPGAVSVLRWDVAAVLRRSGLRALDAATVDSVPPGLPDLGGAFRRLEAFYTPNRSHERDAQVGWIAIELDLRGESPVPRWRRRFESQVEERPERAPERADVEWLVGQAWCDLLGQVEAAFREREFWEAVVGDQGTGTRERAPDRR